MTTENSRADALTDLLPCPFCGGTDLEIANTHTPSFWVRCNECDAEATGEHFPTPTGTVRENRFHYSPTPDDTGFEATFENLHPEYQEAFRSAVNAWNRRTPALQPAAVPIDEPVAAWINYPVKTVDGEFAGYEKPELSFTRHAYGYDITMAEPLYRRAGAPAAAPETEQSIAADSYYWIAERIGTKDGYSVQEHVDAMCQVIDECADYFHDFVGADEGGNDEAVRIAKNIRALKAGVLQNVSAPTAPAPTDERAAFEKVFPMPADCQRIGNGRTAGYAPTEYGAWEANAFIRRWEGWKAARSASANETQTCSHQWTWADGKCADCGMIAQQPHAESGMTLAERIAHVGGRITEGGYVEFGSAMAVDALIQHALRDARASANETGAEGTQQLSTEIRELKAKLGSYEREREDQIRYLAAQSEEIAGFKQQLAQAAEPAAIPDEATFQRLFIKHGGPVDGEGWCINESGLRDFLHELAGTSQPVTIHQVIHQVWVEESSSWSDVTPAYYAERQPSNRRRVYYAPQPPAQADAREGLTDEQRDVLGGNFGALEQAENLCRATGNDSSADGLNALSYALRALLQGANHAE